MILMKNSIYYVFKTIVYRCAANFMTFFCHKNLFERT